MPIAYPQQSPDPRGAPPIHYRLHAGTHGASTVILVQGLGLSGRFWMDLPELISSELGVDVLTPDNRGTGHTPRGTRRPSMSDLAQDILRVADAHGATRFVLAGVSMGSMIAQHVAFAAPNRVSGLLLMATTPGLPFHTLPAPGLWRRLLAGPLKHAPPNVDVLKHVLLSPADFHKAEELFASWTPHFHERAGPVANRHQLNAVAGHRSARRLSKISCPTLVLHGEDDALIPIQNGERVAKRIPNATFVRLPDTGHGVGHTRPSAVLEALRELCP